MSVEIFLTAYCNTDVSRDRATVALRQVEALFLKYSGGTVLLRFQVVDEGTDPPPDAVLTLADGREVSGVRPPRIAPTGSFDRVMTFSPRLALKDGSPLGGIGGGKTCCVRADHADVPDVLIHELVHTLCGVSIGGRPVPFADDNWWYAYPGYDAPDESRGWPNWYTAVLTGNYGDRLRAKRPENLGSV